MDYQGELELNRFWQIQKKAMNIRVFIVYCSKSWNWLYRFTKNPPAQGIHDLVDDAFAGGAVSESYEAFREGPGKDEG
jgi:hypothetical protein